MKWLVVVFVGIISNLGYAQTSEEYLGLYLSVGSTCPFSSETLQERVEGEYYRSKLTPSYDSDAALLVRVSCLDINNESGRKMGYAMNYEIRFSVMNNSVRTLIDEPNFGNLAIASKSDESYLMNNVRDGVSSAITFYFKHMQ